MRGNGFKLHEVRFRFGLKNFFSEGVIVLCNRLLREMVKSPSPEVFQNREDVALRADSWTRGS